MKNNDEKMETIYIQYYSSPCGELILGSFDGKLCLCDWVKDERRKLIDRRLQRALNARYEESGSEVVAKAKTQLDEYFSRRRKTFDVPLLPVGTDFQRKVWSELVKIPYGTTVSYADLSRRLGNPRAVRAVAGANGANALSVFIPCHRVVGSDGSLTGYAGGMEAKRYLLDGESV